MSGSVSIGIDHTTIAVSHGEGPKTIIPRFETGKEDFVYVYSQIVNCEGSGGSGFVMGYPACLHFTRNGNKVIFSCISLRKDLGNSPAFIREGDFKDVYNDLRVVFEKCLLWAEDGNEEWKDVEKKSVRRG